MQIKRLKLSGFKSFVEPTELKIQDGLTGIVGPNGCGKSNLLEALRWVMGEGSPKSMRGGGMEDVIFAGTENRPPREFAEVTLLAERTASENAPAFFANDDEQELDITRRIERGAGSAYRANGADVRAKDVALIFADAATGAHSPALVSQGRIGTIISAKPAERRQMLEEAAGISGLHVRRKDAEQKLRGSERNLEKLSIILDDMGVRAGQLKRQARQAERYRKLSEEITQAEGRLIFVKWRTAKMAADAAKRLAAQTADKVAKAASTQGELARKQEQATQKLASDRAAAMAARDAASDLNAQIITLKSEQERISQRMTDLEQQDARLSEDSAREGKLTHDAAEALESLKAQSEALAGNIAAQEEKRPQLERSYGKAEHALRENELALAKAHAEQARAEAEQRVATSAAEQAKTRLARAGQEAERLTAERDALGNIEEYEQNLNTAKAEKAALEKTMAGIAATLETASSRREVGLTARDEAQNTLANARADLAALQSERSALARALQGQEGDKAIDQVNVTKGYERALAAALGDDANAAIGGDAGRRWSGGAIKAADTDDKRLSEFVKAPSELAARLAMVIVAESDDGRTLKPGERLVTQNGRMRRWDGFVSEEDGTAQAEALIRANRLKEIETLIPTAGNAAEQAANQLSDAETAVAALQDEQKAAETARQSADTSLRQALRDVDRASDALERLQSASAALDERRVQSQQDIKAAKDEARDAQAALGMLPQADAQDKVVARLEQEGEALRNAMMRAQAELSTLDQSLGQERERRAVAEADIRSWRDRAGEAEKRISDMKQRANEIAAEKSELADKPNMLVGQLSDLEVKKEGLSEKLAALQSAETGSETALKGLETKLADAAEALSSAREERAGAAARAENEEGRRIEMGRISGERFECPPPVLPEKLKFGEDELSDSERESSRLEQLQASRERIGPVNLIAADELAELEEERASGLAESEELTLAINQLRGSIGSLNREGRQRLLEAFEAVDGHFRRLFTTLFNGGQAHLALIDSDDPLEAGLEIYAQPPGKKLQSLTLLSGGEQALTAIALIFALFLTNPAPICVLDEVDAPLDDANIERFCDLLDAMNRDTDTRYLIVTHNAVTMSRMNRLFGVTMIEQGVSRLVSVDLGAAEELLAAE